MDENLAVARDDSPAIEATTVRKAQEVLERSSPTVSQICLTVLTRKIHEGDGQAFARLG